jgi:hypothetical protein
LASSALDERERHYQWIKEGLKLTNQHRATASGIAILFHALYYCQVDFSLPLDFANRMETNEDCSSRVKRFRALLKEMLFSEDVDIVLNIHVHNCQCTTTLHRN